jgi:hypothetical protein
MPREIDPVIGDTLANTVAEAVGKLYKRDGRVPLEVLAEYMSRGNSSMVLYPYKQLLERMEQKYLIALERDKEGGLAVVWVSAGLDGVLRRAARDGGT